MKKRLLLSFLLVTQFSFAQDYPQRFSLIQDDESETIYIPEEFIVIEFENKTKDELYKIMVDYVSSQFKDRMDVSKNDENKFIKVQFKGGYVSFSRFICNPGCIWFGNFTSNMEFRFQENRIRIDLEIEDNLVNRDGKPYYPFQTKRNGNKIVKNYMSYSSSTRPKGLEGLKKYFLKPYNDIVEDIILVIGGDDKDDW